MRKHKVKDFATRNSKKILTIGFGVLTACFLQGAPSIPFAYAEGLEGDITSGFEGSTAVSVSSLDEVHKEDSDTRPNNELDDAKKVAGQRVFDIALQIKDEIAKLTHISDQQKSDYAGQVQTEVSKALTNINNSKEVSEVNSWADKGVEAIQNILKSAEEEDGKIISEAKHKAKDEIVVKAQGIDKTIDDSSLPKSLKDKLQAQVKSAVDMASERIDKADTLTGITSAKDEGIAELDKLSQEVDKEIGKYKEIEQARKDALAQIKDAVSKGSSTIAALPTFTTQEKNHYTEKIKRIASSATDAINKSESPSDIATICKKALDDIQAVIDKAVKHNANNENANNIDPKKPLIPQTSDASVLGVAGALGTTGAALVGRSKRKKK